MPKSFFKVSDNKYYNVKPIGYNYNLSFDKS